MTVRPQNLYKKYHAHVYFDAASFQEAQKFCLEAGKEFQVAVGTLHQRPVGPHPYWSCQISFGTEQFDEIIAWLNKYRNGLDILVHGLTGDDLKDHTEHASWLGKASALNLKMFMK
ncbi:MAG: DOPA 4,5-dioxygenase family protein [Limnothrix sp.]